MASLPFVFADGVLDVHVANGVARLTLGAAVAQKDAKPEACGTLVVPVMQLPVFARILGEVTRQLEQRAKEAMAQQGRPAAAAETTEAPAGADQVSGAFRFNG
jgi:hypothetical protein